MKLPPFCVAGLVGAAGVPVMPVPVTLTCAVEVAVDPPGRYCTEIEQLLPAAITKPLMQVPPVIENELAAGPAVLVTAGAAEKVNGPAFKPVAVFETVIVAFFVVVPPDVIAGLGAEIVSVAPTMRNEIVGDPAGVTTVTVLGPSAAFDVMVNVAVTLVELTTLMFDTETPAPPTVMFVAPVRFVPVRLTSTDVPRDPETGLIDVSVAPLTVNGRVPLFPPGVVTRTLCAPRLALVAITNVAVMLVELTTLVPVTVMPVPDVKLTADPVVVKFVPVSVTATLVPRTPEFGLIKESVGAGGFTTVNVTVLEVPFGVVTLTVLAPRPAVVAIVKVAVI